MTPPIPPSALIPPVPPSATTISLPMNPLKADWPVHGLPEGEWCELCHCWVYEAEDSEAFCRMKHCLFRARFKSKS